MNKMVFWVIALLISQPTYANDVEERFILNFLESNFKITNFKRCNSTLNNCVNVKELVEKMTSLAISSEGNYSFPTFILFENVDIDALRPFIGPKGYPTQQAIRPIWQEVKCKSNGIQHFCVMQIKAEVESNEAGTSFGLVNYNNKLTFRIDRSSMEAIPHSIYYRLKNGAKITIVFESTTYHDEKFNDDHWKTTKTILEIELEKL